MKVPLGFALIILASSAFAQQAEPTRGAAGTTRGVASAVRFAATAELPVLGGQAQTYPSTLGDIKVSGNKRVQIPASGFYVATLVTNDVISVEGDQRVLRHTGDFGRARRTTPGAGAPGKEPHGAARSVPGRGRSRPR